MISIIVPVYNVEPYLRQCLDSILCQTERNIEVICVDDGSTDASARILDAYAAADSRVQVIHKENSGLVSARKVGLKAAIGEYIGYVDSDDWIEPDMYERLLTALIREGADVSMCGRFEDTGERCREVRHGFAAATYDKRALTEKIYPGMIVNGAFFEWGIFPGMTDKLFKRECLEPFQMAVDERITMGEDAVCTYPALLHVKCICILDECLYHYRQNPSSIVRQKANAEIERQRFRLLYQVGLRELERGKAIYDLTSQWKEYLLFLMVPRADALLDGIEKLDYLFPFPGVKRGSEIILYGMGTYGQRLHRFLEESGFCHVVACADRNYEELNRIGMDVISPERMADYDCDVIVAANSFAGVRQEIERELTERFPQKKVYVINEDLIKSEEIIRRFGLVQCGGVERAVKEVNEVNEGTILPARYFSEIYDWGLGGVLDKDGEFVPESGMEVMHRFGGAYQYDEKECDYSDETVIYVGPIRTHWGHFLAECSVRFWYFLENQEAYRVAFCGLWFAEGGLSPKLMDILGFLGVEKKRLLDIRKPTKFKRILIPLPALEFEPYRFMPGKIENFFANWGKHSGNWSYTADFKKVYQTIARKVDVDFNKTAEMIYYTRTGMDKKNEIGEKLLEKIFRKNGFVIISPEKESVETQIALMKSCKFFVSIEGTLAHNILFARENLKQTILLKKAGENALQAHLNQCMNINAESVYVGCRPFGRRFPRGGWDGIYWLRPSKAFRVWCRNHNMWFPGPLEVLIEDLKNLFAYTCLCGQEISENLKIAKEDRRMLKRVKKYERIVLYGVNTRCLRWKSKIERKYPQKQLYLADTNDKAIQKYIQVYGMDDVVKMRECICLIGITNQDVAEEVKRQLIKRGVEEKRICLSIELKKK